VDGAKNILKVFRTKQIDKQAAKPADPAVPKPDRELHFVP
jgi:hypothetical protein